MSPDETQMMMREQTALGMMVLSGTPALAYQPTTGARTLGFVLPKPEQAIANLVHAGVGWLRECTSDGGAVLGAVANSYGQRLVQTAGLHPLVIPILYPPEFASRSGIKALPTISAPVAEPPADDDPHTSAQRLMVETIGRRTGLSRQRIADLIGVSRPTIYAWLNDHEILEANLRRLLAVYDVLQRASARHRTPREMQVWLHAPQGVDAQRPIDLLEIGEFDRARLLALSSALPRREPVPTWIRESEPNAWSLREEARRAYLGREDREAEAALLADDDEAD